MKLFNNVSEAEKKFSFLYGDKESGQLERYTNGFNKFKEIFKEDSCYIASSSGRVEVIGNHTDHNGGRVISCAISLDSLAFILPTNDNVIRVYSEGYGEITVDVLGKDVEKKGTSSALIRGVVVGLKEKGYNVGGFKGYITSNVLGGAGISSSASFEVLIAEIENAFYNDGKISCEEKAKISQFSENVYFGKPCGLLDQTAISFGGLNKLDFSDKNKIGVEKIDSQLTGYSFVLVNTGGSHENLTDEYAAVPKEMFNVAKALNKDRLIEIKEEEFYNKLPLIYKKLSDREILRAIHFYQENERVDKASEALNKNDIKEFIKCINESGISSEINLQNCYVKGSDVQTIPKALSYTKKYIGNGANRIHGGGFAGSILCVMKNELVDKFIAKTKDVFGLENIIPLSVRSVGTVFL